MPVGLFTTWTPCGEGLKTNRSWRAADNWLAWVSRDLTHFRTRLDDGGETSRTQAIARGWLPRRQSDPLRVSRLLLALPSMLVDRRQVQQLRSGSRLVPVRGGLETHAGETRENGRQEPIPGEFARPDGGGDRRMLVISSKIRPRPTRDRDLSRPALSRSQREVEVARAALASCARGHLLWSSGCGH